MPGQYGGGSCTSGVACLMLGSYGSCGGGSDSATVAAAPSRHVAAAPAVGRDDVNRCAGAPDSGRHASLHEHNAAVNHCTPAVSAHRASVTTFIGFEPVVTMSPSFINPLVTESQLQIAQSAKKLWGVDDHSKDDKRLYNIGEQPWREPWSTGPATNNDHGMSAAVGMIQQQQQQLLTGSFASGSAAVGAGDAAPPAAPAAEALTVKMMEYVLANGTTAAVQPAELDVRMRSLALTSGADAEMEDSATTYEQANSVVGAKDVHSPSNGLSGVQPPANGLSGPQTPASQQTNGLATDDPAAASDAFSRTASSPQPSLCSDEVPQPSGPPPEPVAASNGEYVGPSHAPPIIGPPVLQPPQPQRQPLTGHQVQPPLLDAPGFSHHHHSQSQQHHHHQQQPPPQHHHHQHAMSQHHQQEQQSFEQQRFMNNGLQLITQQQYMAAAAQQQGQLSTGLAGAGFGLPYIAANGQEQQYIIASMFPGPAMFPGYYGMPYVYPAAAAAAAGLLPATGQQQPPSAVGGAPGSAPLQPGGGRSGARPPTPSGSPVAPAGIESPPTGAALPYMFPAGTAAIYEHQHGSLMLRGMAGGGQMRLVSPAPVIINSALGAAPSLRMLGAAGAQQQHAQVAAGQPAAAAAAAAAAAVFGVPTSYSSAAISSGVDTLTNGSVGGAGFAGLGGLQSAGYAGSGSGSLLSGSAAAARRDSLDRASTSFSPGVEYKSPRWANSYAGLGSAAGGSAGLRVTPPPNPLGSGLMQLGALGAAAPGAESRHHNAMAAAAAGVFGPPAGMPGMFPSTRRHAAAQHSIERAVGRSKLLEDFRNNRFPSLQLRDLVNHFREFSQDQHGSRFIQQKLERASPAEKQLVFAEILSASYGLMTDVFGNYVIQKFFEFGTGEQKSTLVQRISGHVLSLSTQMYGCRVIQKALETVSSDEQRELVRELDGHVVKCVKDQNGNHVVQKCIECIDATALQFVVEAFRGQVLVLSSHPYGCRVIQRMLEHCSAEQTRPLLDELHQAVELLLHDQYGNYVVQHVVEHGPEADRSRIVQAIRGKLLTLAQHKFASNVVEKAVVFGSRQERVQLIDELLAFSDSTMLTVLKDQFGNYVIQKMIDVAEAPQRKLLLQKLRPHVANLKRYTFGKHILTKLEKFLGRPSPAPAELGPIGPPATANGSAI